MSEDFLMNRLANCKNPYQGEFKKVLCVCSAGLLRSPTTAYVLSQDPFNFNTRSVGLVKEFALISIDKVLIEWADEIVCMQENQASAVSKLTDKPIICLDIDDSFQYRDPQLINKIKENYLAKQK